MPVNILILSQLGCEINDLISLLLERNAARVFILYSMGTAGRQVSIP